MKYFSVFIIIVLVLTAAGIVFLGGSEKRAWRQAEENNSIESYESFLGKYPDGDFASVARENLFLLKEALRWERLISEPAAESFSAFISDYPDSRYIGEAKKRFSVFLIPAACEHYIKTQDADPNRPLEEFEKIAAMAQGGRPPGDPNDYRIAIDILAELQKLPEAELIRISFPDVQPESGGDCYRLGAYAMSKNIYVTGNMTGIGTKLSLRGIIVPTDGGINNAVDLMEGYCPILNLESRRRNFAGNIAVTADSEGALVAYAELPDEWVFYKMGGFRPTDDPDKGILIPNGHGTVIRFKGVVKDFFPGFTIHGSEEYPLVFVLLRQTGLTYVCGEGSVAVEDGRKWLFPNEDLRSKNKGE